MHGLFTLANASAAIANAALLLAPPLAWAQGLGQIYPTKPVRVIVPYPAGGGADLVARMMTQKLADGLGQPVVVDNRAGAGTIIGTEIAARAAPDGYTLIMVNPAHAINPGLRQLPYESIRDFAAVILIATQPNLFVVHPSLLANNTGEFIALARAKPGLRYASAGIGSVVHLAAELLASMTGIKLTHVPYKGAGGYMPDLVGGRVEFTIAPIGSLMQQVQAGRLRALAVTTATRVAALPEVPTAAEGGVPGYQALSWYLLLAPARTPAGIVNKLNAEMNKILGGIDIRQRLAREGSEAAGGTPTSAMKFLRDETALWTGVIQRANVKAE